MHRNIKKHCLGTIHSTKIPSLSMDIEIQQRPFAVNICKKRTSEAIFVSFLRHPGEKQNAFLRKI